MIPLPLTVRSLPDEGWPQNRSTTRSRNVRLRPRLLDEDQLPWIQMDLFHPLPRAACRQLPFAHLEHHAGCGADIFSSGGTSQKAYGTITMTDPGTSGRSQPQGTEVTSDSTSTGSSS